MLQLQAWPGGGRLSWSSRQGRGNPLGRQGTHFLRLTKPQQQEQGQGRQLPHGLSLTEALGRGASGQDVRE